MAAVPSVYTRDINCINWHLALASSAQLGSQEQPAMLMAPEVGGERWEYWQCDDNIVVGSWWQVEWSQPVSPGPPPAWCSLVPGAAWWSSVTIKTSHWFECSGGRTRTMAVKGLYWTILLASWLQLAFSESIMDYLRNREDLSQVSWMVLSLHN